MEKLAGDLLFGLKKGETINSPKAIHIICLGTAWENEDQDIWSLKG